MKAEMQRRQTNADKLRAFFEARPGEWIPARDLEFAGRQAWRTRVSELRVRLETAGDGTIEWNHKTLDSAYRFLPHKPLGRDAAEQVPQSWTSGGPFTPEFELKP